MIRVFIIHEIRLMCSMVSSSLKGEQDIKVVGCAKSLEEARAQDSEHDVLLVSAGLPNQGALSAARMFRSNPNIKVVVLGLPNSEPAILHFVEAGASGYVCRENSTEELLKTIRAVHSGEAHISPGVAAAMIVRMAELSDWVKNHGVRVADAINANLTDREYEVLTLIARGCSNQDIAAALTIELGTVKNHVHNILRKLNVNSREEAAACLPWLAKELDPSDLLAQYARGQTSAMESAPAPRFSGPALRRSGVAERRGGRRAYDLVGLAA